MLNVSSCANHVRRWNSYQHIIGTLINSILAGVMSTTEMQSNTQRSATAVNAAAASQARLDTLVALLVGRQTEYSETEIDVLFTIINSFQRVATAVKVKKTRRSRVVRMKRIQDVAARRTCLDNLDALARSEHTDYLDLSSDVDATDAEIDAMFTDLQSESRMDKIHSNDEIE